MSRFAQIEGAVPDAVDCWSEAPTQGWDGLELCSVQEFHLRGVAWSLGLSSIMWYSLITVGFQVWKVWH